MLGVLVKKELLDLFRSYFVNTKNGKGRGFLGSAMYILGAIAIFGGLGIVFYIFFGSISMVLVPMGLSWLYFSIFALVAMALGVFGSVFNTYASLYLGKDNELMLSLPIPTETLLLSKLVTVYLMSLLYSGWVWIPAGLAFYKQASLSFLTILCPFLMTFVIALFVTVLTCILGYLVAIISAKAKGKSYLTVVLSLIVGIGYYYVYFKVVNSLNGILEHLDELGQMVSNKHHFITMLGKAAAGDPLSLLIFSAITAFLFYLCVKAIAGNFLKVATASKNSIAEEKKALKVKSKPISKTLLDREVKHFTSSATWMLNGGLGILIMPVLALAAIVKRELIIEMAKDLLNVFPEIGRCIPIFLMAGVCLIICMNAITAPSVSLEGKSMWIIRSLPVDPWEVLSAKAGMHVRFNIYPALFLTVVLCLILELPPTMILLIGCGIWLFIWVTAYLGLSLNLLKPNLSWTNEVAPIKQSFAVFFVMFGGWAYSMLMMAAGYFMMKVLSDHLTVAFLDMVFLAAYLLLKRWLKTRGSEIFETLS